MRIVVPVEKLLSAECISLSTFLPLLTIYRSLYFFKREELLTDYPCFYHMWKSSWKRGKRENFWSVIDLSHNYPHLFGKNSTTFEKWDNI